MNLGTQIEHQEFENKYQKLREFVCGTGMSFSEFNRRAKGIELGEINSELKIWEEKAAIASETGTPKVTSPNPEYALTKDLPFPKHDGLVVHTFYHGSDCEITEFDLDKCKDFHVHLGTRKQAECFGQYIHKVQILAGGNSIKLDDLGTWRLPSLLRELKGIDVISNDEVDHCYLWDKQQSGQGERALREILLRKGYDSIKYENAVEQKGDESILLLTTEQVVDIQLLPVPAKRPSLNH